DIATLAGVSRPTVDLWLGRYAGVSHYWVAKLWREHGLRPHRSGTYKLSKDPQFAGESPTSSAYTWSRSAARWSSASTRRPRSRPSTAHSRCCPSSAAGGAAGAPSPGMERRRSRIRSGEEVSLGG
ncbi:LOW QUALITY PROTEIN: feruloyl esterase, partial [Micromonospora sp. ATCC 39149]